jgi:ABC-type nitrate/sulfonate/bicarbonate transport system permease component
MATIKQTADAQLAAPRSIPPSWRIRARFIAIAPYLSISALLIVWELVSHSSLVTPFMLPAIETVVAQIWHDIATGDVFLNVGLTLYRTFIGFAIASVLGVAIGIVMSRSRLAHWFFDPIISVGFPMPKVAFLPVFILWFGLFDLSKIMLIIVNAIFPVVISTVAGLSQVEREIVWSARSMGASERRIAWEITFCAALPQILTGLQVALPVSLIVAIVAELIMGGEGLGSAMITSARYLLSPGVFAGIVEIAIVGYAVLKIMELTRRRLLVWHVEESQVAMT